MCDGECILSFVVFDKLIACYVIKSNEIYFLSESISDDDLNLISELPKNLSRDRCDLPDSILRLNCKIKFNIGDGKVIAVFPSGILHLIPWRVLLSQSGLKLSQLIFTTGLCSLLHIYSKHTQFVTFSALGFGCADNLSLNDEAEIFSDKISGCLFVENCTSNAVYSELEVTDVVLVSCHGDIRFTWNKEDHYLSLSMRDGEIKIDDIMPSFIRTKLVILSACYSGVYDIVGGEYPVGAAPDLIKRGALYCICARFPVRAIFARDFSEKFASFIELKMSAPEAFSSTLDALSTSKIWKDLACFELISL